MARRRLDRATRREKRQAIDTAKAGGCIDCGRSIRALARGFGVSHETLSAARRRL